MERVVIIGNGAAGRACAEVLAPVEHCEVVLIGREHPLPISRPGLIYRALGAMRNADLELPVPRNVRCLYGEVIHWSATERWVELDSGERITFDQLVWAIGATARAFQGEQSESLPVFRLQELADAEALSRISFQRWGVVGGGLIGAEMSEWGVAKCGETHWWTNDPYLWAGRLNAEEGEALVRRVRSFGVIVHLNDPVHGLAGQVQARSGTYEVDGVGLAIGVESAVLPGTWQPNTPSPWSWVHAIGDVTKSMGRSWQAATWEGRALGRQILGLPLEKRTRGLDERSRCFDRTVTSLRLEEPIAESGFVDVDHARSVRVGWNEQGQWVSLTAMGWRVRSTQLLLDMARGCPIQSLPAPQAVFFEPEGTSLPKGQWNHLINTIPC